MRKKATIRFQEIVKVFVFYGFGFLVDSKKESKKKSPVNLRKAFEELGPTFIKIGQILSTRPDILPEIYINELVKLQDSAPIENFNDIKEVFEKSVGKTLEESFIYFNPRPLASASVAQVHDGILKDGRSVAVKIQRPDIYEKMHMDISILKKIFKFTNAKINIIVVDPIEVLNEIENATKKELDFIIEAENIKRFKKNNINITPVYAPKTMDELCSDKVLTLEKIEGFKINNITKIKDEGYDNKDIARKLALCYCKQIFDDGFFHGDPHPGNILIWDSKICFIDFGIVGELSESTRSLLNSAMIAIATSDKNKLVDFILAVGIKRGKVDRSAVYEDVSYLVDTYITTRLKNIKIAVLLDEMFNLAKNNNIQFPRELVLLLRGLMILEGVISDIDPELEISSVVISFVKSKGKLLFLKDISQDELLIAALSFFRDSSRIPSKAVDALNSITEGRTKINFKINDIEKVVSDINKMVNRIIGALLIASLVIASALITSNNVGPIYKGVSLLGIIGYVISAVFAIVLLFTMVKAGEFKYKSKK